MQSVFAIFVLFGLRDLQPTAGAQTSVAVAPSSGTDSSWTPQFRAPQLTPTMFLIVSSPSQAKVVYTELKNFKSIEGRTYPLVDSGLGEPTGIAIDRERGDLYVVDRQALKIFRYELRVHESRDRDGYLVRSLVTDDNRLTILSGRNATDVTVDVNGDVFYTDPGSKSINKITAGVMDRIAAGEVTAENLALLSEKEQEATAASSVAGSLNAPAGEEETTPEPSLSAIMSIYEGSMNPSVSVPAAVVSDGVRLYWTNAEDGLASGSVVRGESNPKAPPTMGENSDPQPFPAEQMANNTARSFGIAKSNTMVFYSSMSESQGVVYGANANKYDPNVLAFAQGLGEPRGLVWDGDNTVFVADSAINVNAVYSFPVGRLQEAAPLTKAVEIEGAYGVALLAEGDEAFALKSGTLGPRIGCAFVFIVAFLHLRI